MCKLSDLEALTWQWSGPGLHSVLQPGSTAPPQTAYGRKTLSAGPWQQQESKTRWQSHKPGVFIDVGSEKVTSTCGISHWTQAGLTRGTASEDKPFTRNRDNLETGGHSFRKQLYWTMTVQLWKACTSFTYYLNKICCTRLSHNINNTDYWHSKHQ